MIATDWINLVGIVLTVAISVCGSAFGVAKYLGKGIVDKAVSDSELASSINRLAESITEMSEGIKHMDDRLDQHDIDIAILKDRQTHA